MKKVFLVLALLAGLWQGVVGQVDLQEVWQKPATETIKYAKFSPDGNFIYCALGSTIRKMDAKTGNYLSVFDNVDSAFIYEIDKMQISASGKYIVAGNSDGAVVIWNTITEKKVKQFQIGMSCVCITNDDKYLYIATSRPDNQGISIYNLETDKIDTVINFFHNGDVQIALSHDGSHFAFGYNYQDDFTKNWHDVITLFEAGTWKKITNIENHEAGSTINGYRLLKFSKDDNYIGYIRENWNGPWIYSVSENKFSKTPDQRDSYSFDILPDNIYVLIYYKNEWVELKEISNNIITKIFNNLHAGIIESCISMNNDKLIFMYGDTNRVLKLIPTGVSELPMNDGQVQINQLNNQIIITTVNTDISNIVITISDLQGRLFYSEKANLASGSYSLNVNLASGIYLCTVKAGNKQYSKKFEIVR